MMESNIPILLKTPLEVEDEAMSDSCRIPLEALFPSANEKAHHLSLATNSPLHFCPEAILIGKASLTSHVLRQLRI